MTTLHKFAVIREGRAVPLKSRPVQVRDWHAAEDDVSQFNSSDEGRQGGATYTGFDAPLCRFLVRSSSAVERVAHNHDVVGSIPTPASIHVYKGTHTVNTNVTVLPLQCREAVVCVALWT